jgi:glycosyltransferase involved in cell wall biosynthesis
MSDTDFCIMNNIPTPYRQALFESIARLAADRGRPFSVLYLSRNESVRDWSVKLNSFETVLSVRRQKRNPTTPTSDFITNNGYLGLVLRPTTVILFGYNYRTYLATALVRRLLGRETYLFCETTLMDTSKSNSKKVIKEIIFRLFFDRFIVPGQRSAEFLNAHGVPQDRVFFARNASHLCPNQPPKLNPAAKIRLLYVGRLAPEKRILEFVRVFSHVDTSATLTLVGSGPFSQEIADIAAGDERIEMLPSLDQNHLSAIYARHDALVLVSKSEPWGLVVNEAINFGLALMLSPEVGCLPDLLDGNGVQVKTISHNGIDDAIRTLQRSLLSYRQRSLEIARETTVEQQAEAFMTSISKNCDDDN